MSLPQGTFPLCPDVMRTVTSRQNATVREFRALADHPDPAGRLLLLDGAHLVSDARRAGLHLLTAAVAAARLERDTEEGTLARLLDHERIDVIAVPDQVMRAISPVQTPSGIAAIARREPDTLDGLCSAGAFLLAVAGVQDPGNIGSLMRAAEAGGVTGAIVCTDSANPFSWKALRGSMGSALRLPIVSGSRPDAALAAVERAGMRTVAAVAHHGADPDAISWHAPVALFLGGEGHGLADEIAGRCHTRVSIPMAGQVESLNVAVAGAILIYAARRARLIG